MTKRNRRNASDDFLSDQYDYPTRSSPNVKKFAIKYLNIKQKEYGRTISQNTIIFAIGSAGSGKTHLAALHAMDEYLSGRIDKIVICRPVVNAGGEQLGFLPGTLNEKMDPYVKPIFDAFAAQWNPKQIQTMLEYGKIEIAPLAFMRGRTFRDAFIICDEAQNATDEQLLMLLSRLGEGSKMIITGDPTQRDIKGRPFEKARRRLSGLNGIEFVDFTEDDVVRHPLVQQILRVWSPKAPVRDDAGLEAAMMDAEDDDIGELRRMPGFITKPVGAPAPLANGHAAEGDD
jgi:phosphate starvation-inducible PhoH-like protein